MPEPATDDRAAAYLADARRRWEAFGEADSLPALLGAVEALLKPHQPGRIALTGRVCSRHADYCYFSITSAEAAEVQTCQDCAAIVYISCAGCNGASLDNCPTRRAITTALTGGTDG